MYEVVDLYTVEELGILRELVRERIREVSGEVVSLDTYHLDMPVSGQRMMLPKYSRILSPLACDRILKLPGTTALLRAHAGYGISSVVHDSNHRENRPEFYFRLVRPSQLSDVGSPHCDFWFDLATGTGFGRGNTIKFWIPLVQERGLNGLLFYPGATADVAFRIEEIDGSRRPVIDCDLNSLGLPVLAELDYGQALKFRDEILHGGAVNNGRNTRVSLEITLVREDFLNY